MPCLDQLGELQRHIPELRELDAEIIAIASRGGQEDVEKTKTLLGLTFALIPTPNRKVAEDFGVYDVDKKWAIATLILDKGGIVQFKYISKDTKDRPSFSRIIEALRENK